MQKIKQLIQDGISGGWMIHGFVKPERFKEYAGAKGNFTFSGGKNKTIWSTDLLIEQILLDTNFIKAVGKTRGWMDKHSTGCITKRNHNIHPQGDIKMFECDCYAKDECQNRHHQFLDALWNNKPLLEAITAFDK